VLRSKLKEKDMQLSDASVQQAMPLMQQLCVAQDFGNGRDMETLAKEIMQQWCVAESKRPAAAAANIDETITISNELLCSVIRASLEEKRRRGAAAKIQSAAATAASASSPHPQPQLAAASMFAPVTRITSETSAAAAAQSQQSTGPSEGMLPSLAETSKVVTVEESQPSPIDGRDAGVTDVVWMQLQRDREAQKAKEEELRQLQEEEEAVRLELQRAEQEAADAARQAAAEDDERQKRLQQRIQRARDLALAAARAEMEQVLKAREAARQAQLLEQKRQAQLQRMGVCVAGYAWIKQSGGYRCAGGSHVVSDAQLQ
jgi:hypothetical protein